MQAEEARKIINSVINANDDDSFSWELIDEAFDTLATNTDDSTESLMLQVLKFGGMVTLEDDSTCPNSLPPAEMMLLAASQWFAANAQKSSDGLMAMANILANSADPLLRKRVGLLMAGDQELGQSEQVI